VALRDVLITKAESIKLSVAEVETALDVGDIVTARTAFARLHAKLNGLAHRAADHFGGDVQTFSGGTDKPEED
jgi:hypothetical protein